MPDPIAYADYIGSPRPDNVIPFPNPDLVSPSNTGPRRFFIQETRFYVVYAEDEEHAIQVFTDMATQECEQCETGGGEIRAFAADH